MNWTRADRHSAEPDHGGGEMDEACEVDGASVVSGGEATEMLEAAEASFDLVTMLLGTDIVRDGDLAVALGRDHRLSLHGGDPGT